MPLAKNVGLYGWHGRHHPREIVEAALAHVVQNKVEAAYMRSDLFECRRRLMNDGAAYLAARIETRRPDRSADPPPSQRRSMPS